MNALIFPLFFTIYRLEDTQKALLKIFLSMVVRHHKNSGRFVHLLPVNNLMKLCLTHSICNQLSNYLENIVRVLRTAYQFCALIVCIIIGSLKLSVHMPTSLPCHVRFYDTLQSSLTSSYHGTSRHDLLNLVPSRSSPRQSLPFILHTFRRYFRPRKELGPPALLRQYRHSSLIS